MPVGVVEKLVADCYQDISITEQQYADLAKQVEAAHDDRLLKLPTFCIAMLSRRQASAASEYVFDSAAHTLMDSNNYRSRRRSLLVGTGYEWVTPKIARKAVATLLNKTIGPAAAGQQLGHARGSTTTQKYYIETVQETVDFAEILQAFGKISSE